MAMRVDKGPEQRVTDNPLRSPEEDIALQAAVRKGIEQADRGEFVSEEEMNARIRRMTAV